MKVALVVGILALSVTFPAAAQTSPPSPPSPFDPQLSASFLETARAALRNAQRKQSLTWKAEPSPQKPRVVCGMMMIPADPKLDAAIRRPAPSEDGLKFTLQMVVPPVCRQ